MRDLYSVETVFATADTALHQNNFDHIILHYVNYGYQKRGVPFRLLSVLRRLSRWRMLTIFHELYASGPPWQSAFWLKPLQVHIARSITHLSRACIVSTDLALKQLKALMPTAEVTLCPVFSGLGEPLLSEDQLINRSPHRWVICGGTTLVQRSLHSFREFIDKFPERYRPEELFVIGGEENREVRNILAGLSHLQTEYCPRISSTEASKILSSCSFNWLDYFPRAGVPTGILLKSSAFAAACAHGVITILPQSASAISVPAGEVPGPYSVNGLSDLPLDRQKIAVELYRWYQRCAASEHLAREIGKMLNLST